MGFLREVGVLDELDGPFLYVERLAYLKAIRDALAGVESSSVVLAKARQRHRDEARGEVSHAAGQGKCPARPGAVTQTRTNHRGRSPLYPRRRTVAEIDSCPPVVRRPGEGGLWNSAL
jgi:hypothetical protein